MVVSKITLVAAALVLGASVMAGAEDKDLKTIFSDLGKGTYHHVLKPTANTVAVATVKVKNGSVKVVQYSYNVYAKPTVINAAKSAIEVVKLPAKGTWDILVEPATVGFYHGVKNGPNHDLADGAKQTVADSRDGIGNAKDEVQEDGQSISDKTQQALKVTIVPVGKGAKVAGKKTYIALCKFAGGCESAGE